ncbi:hypothetical protein EIP91_009466 [Steccherinum ochraceum]|uniref:ubiquitinyl hydrolase 1 n=1 Tax=Steccherinum ochraceum TaxID=92696 RepID=A0A4R0RRM4_9APHY|nr:hypothetical protein EIP91_009466 [Steccherinum ochraceum]
MPRTLSAFLDESTPMPPKRPRRHSPSTSGPAAGERLKRAKLAGSDYSAWGWVGSEVTDVSDISLSHRLAACGFAPNSNLPLCENKYAGKSTVKPPQERPKEKPGHGELEDDIIVVSDDEAPSCSSKSCRSNPYCLNYLGQDKWEVEDKARDAFLKQAHLGENPIYLARDPGAPIGLKNLGATCYANAFLQVWFQDRAFRTGVYQCKPPQDSTQKFEESPIFQLQVTFSAMQESTQNAFNPVKLVESLKLRTTEQQDAQEFSKLFMAHLDTEFQKQTVPGLKSLLADQFQGKQVYGTLCSSCKTKSERDSEFLEIEVNIDKNNAKLEDRLNALLQPEDLSGDNKYFCSVCDGLKDAKRYTEFRELPPVLHVSLLRFVFDLQTMERKKSKNTISFPLTLDMNPYLGSKESRKIKEEDNAYKHNVYHLRGVLLHKGSSAYHGHYEAQVFDVQNKSWYQFNDEDVTKMDSLVSVLKPPIAREGSQSNAQRGRPKKKPTRIDDSDVEIIERLSTNKTHRTLTPKSETAEQSYVSSRDAYMLVYARDPGVSESRATTPVKEGDEHVNGVAALADIPLRAREVVNDMNAEYDKACDDYAQKEQEAKRRFEEKRRMVMDIYRSWTLSSRDDESAVVSRQALELWLGRHVTKPPKAGTDKDKHSSILVLSEDGSLCTISNADITCEHGQLDPTKSSHMKRVQKAAMQRISDEDQCHFSPALTSTDIYWRLNKPKMHEPSQQDPSPGDADFSGHVKCEHGGLTTNQGNRKRISSEGYKILKEIFPGWETLSSDDEVCPVCEALLHISREDKREIRKQAEDEKAKLKHMYDMAVISTTSAVEGEPCAIIPKHFASSWKQWLFRPTELQRPEGIDNTRFLCRHSNLIIDPNVASDVEGEVVVVRRQDYDVLENLYPCGPLIALESDGDKLISDIPVCEECRTERKSSFETTDLTVRLLKASDPIPTPATFHKDDTVVESRERPSYPITYGSRKVNGVRQSKRIRQVNGRHRQRKITITREMTVKELKIEIQNEESIPTIYQRLFHRGHELEDNAVTLVSLGVLSNDVLDLREEPEDVEMIESGDEDGAPRKRTDEGRAFGGTLLSGGDLPAAVPSTSSESHETTPAVETPIVVEKACPACTFINPPDVLMCTICDTVFNTNS